MDTETCRALARQHTGVYYDVRSRKFCAEVYSHGVKHFAGSFDTVEQASAAYFLKRAELPSKRAATLGVADKIAALGAKPDDGASFDLGDQTYTLVKTSFRKVGGRVFPFFQWASTCRECGEPFETLTPASSKAVKGITRNCEAHRKANHFSKAKARKTSDFAAMALDIAEALALLDDTFTTAAFMAERQRLYPDAGDGFRRFVYTDPASPVEFVPEDRLRMRIKAAG